MKKSGKAEPRVRQIIPVVRVRDVRHTLAFYTDRLGFEQQFAVGDPPNYGVVSRDGQIIHFLKADNSTSADGFGLYVWVDDLDSFFAECESAGLEIAGPPTAQPYGMREFAMNDPNGIRVTFAEEAD